MKRNRNIHKPKFKKGDVLVSADFHYTDHFITVLRRSKDCYVIEYNGITTNFYQTFIDKYYKLDSSKNTNKYFDRDLKSLLDG